ncbi:hypothetical protein ES705_10930 [subsurface metagenome]
MNSSKSKSKTEIKRIEYYYIKQCLHNRIVDEMKKRKKITIVQGLESLMMEELLERQSSGNFSILEKVIPIL